MIPIDPKEQKREEEEQRLHRAALVPMLLAMVLVAGAAGYVFWQELTKIMPPPASPETMSRVETRGLEGLDPLESPIHVSGDVTVSDLIAQHGNDAPLMHEPANLAPFPRAVRVAGLERSGGQFIEQISVWRVVGASSDEVQSHYATDAAKQGFQPLGSDSGAQPRGSANNAATSAAPGNSAVHQVYWAPPVAASDGRRSEGVLRSFGRVLTLRIDPAADGSLRVLLDLTQPVRP